MSAAMKDNETPEEQVIETPKQRVERLSENWPTATRLISRQIKLSDAIEREIRAAEQAMKARCMAAVCVQCGVRRPVEKRDGGWWHVSKPGGILLPDGHCHASPIRDLEDSSDG